MVRAPVLAYPSFDRSFLLETDPSVEGLGAVFSQTQEDGQLHPVAYASRVLSPQECNYGITALETLAVVWATFHFHSYLYGHEVTVYIDHSAVKVVLEAPNLSSKHARWWTKVYGQGMKKGEIWYHPGKSNSNTDALSHSQQGPAPTEEERDDDVQVSALRCSEGSEVQTTVTDLLQTDPADGVLSKFGEEQRKDPHIQEVISFLETEELPSDEH